MILTIVQKHVTEKGKFHFFLSFDISFLQQVLLTTSVLMLCLYRMRPSQKVWGILSIIYKLETILMHGQRYRVFYDQMVVYLT